MKVAKKTHVGANALCGLFAALIAAGAFLRIPIPVVPFTLQFLFTNLAGLMLGKKRGAAAVGVYIVLGLLGLPVFAAGGGIGYIFQPTFGYILGFALGAWAAGSFMEKRKEPGWGSSLLASLLNLSIVYFLGVGYYFLIDNVYLPGDGIGLWPLLLHGFLLVVPGDILLCFVSACLYKRLEKEVAV